MKRVSATTTNETQDQTKPKEKAMATKTSKSGTKPTNEESPLAGFIPPSFYIDDYVSREIAGINDLSLLGAAHRNRHNVLLAGPTGSAKTTVVYAYAASKNLPVINVACNGAIDTKQLIGGWSPTPEGGFRFVPGDLVLGVMHGAVILLNEVNFMPPKIAAIVYGLLDRRRTIFIPDATGSDFPTVVKAHPDTFICADYNPGYQGTRPLNQAFKNRFAFKLDWGYEHDVETQLVTSPELLLLVEDLRRRAEAGDIVTPISTNMMMEFEDLAYDDELGYDYAVLNFVNAFEPDERMAVTEIFNLRRDKIKAELFDTEAEEELL